MGRFAFAVFTMMSAIVPGIVVYILLWIVMGKPLPEDAPAD